MASLTESSLIYDISNPKEPKEPKNPKKNWYNRVYLCVEITDCKSDKISQPIKGFNCYIYNSIENADLAWNTKLTEYHKMNIRHTILPICKWVPIPLDKYILNWKLNNIYWLGKHTLGNIYNGYNKKY